jgi:DNA polymerase I-like protein with 3'-5' exonuclease and polymerase domains
LAELPEILRPSCTRQHKWLQMPDEVCRRYNAFDLLYQAKLLAALESDLRRNGQLEFYHRWREIVPVAMRMQRRGFGVVDWDAHARVSAELHQELREVEAGVAARTKLFGRLREEADRWRAEDEAADWTAARAKNAARKRPKPDGEVEPTRAASREKRYASKLRKIEERRESFFNFSNDLRSFLFDELALTPAPASKRHNRPERSVKADAVLWMLERLPKREEHGREVLEALARVFRIRKVIQGYLQPLQTNPDLTRDGRLHPRIKLYAVETLRWSYADPSLHNWPPQMQPIVRAAPGHQFVSVDYKQIEAGIMAILAGDEEELREWLAPDGDLHRLMAMDALGLTRPQWDALDPVRRKDIRDTFKTVRYERMYGGEGTKARSKGAQGAVREALSAVELKRAVERWSARHPRMVEWRDRLLREVRAGGNSWTSPFGYRRVSCQPIDEAKRSWFNAPMQHCAAMIINRAAVDLDRENCPLVFQHHDSLITEAPDAEVEHWTGRMVTLMTQPIPELRGIGFPVDVKVGLTWKDVK